MRGSCVHKQNCMKSAQVLYEAYTTPTSEGMLSKLLIDTLEYPNEYKNSGLSARAFLNNYVLHHYPNEMVIKSSFVDNVLIKQGKTNISVFELPVGESRVDICKINGCSAAFEIKTDLDSFARLEKQLTDYHDVFEHVSVIVSENRWQSLLGCVPDYCGVYSYRQRKDCKYSFILRRASIKQSEFDSRKQLEVMPKRILSRKAKTNNSATYSEMIDNCLEIYSKREINRLFKNYLKGRYGKNWEFIKARNTEIYEIDYEWFFRNNLEPGIVY